MNFADGNAILIVEFLLVSGCNSLKMELEVGFNSRLSQFSTLKNSVTTLCLQINLGQFS
jgi:hypothetical protein